MPTSPPSPPDLIKDFINDGKLATRTKEQYRSCLKKVFDYVLDDGIARIAQPRRKRKTDEERTSEHRHLNEQAIQFLNKTRADEAWVQSQLTAFVMSLKESNEAGTIMNNISVIKEFLKWNRIDLEWKRIARYYDVVNKKADDRIPEISEMERWIDDRDRRVKFVVLIMSSSGIRVGAWKYLRRRHIKPIIKNEKMVAASVLVSHIPLRRC
jgi:ABC-type uncharacterized transport system ATPase subunit